MGGEVKLLPLVTSIPFHKFIVYLGEMQPRMETASDINDCIDGGHELLTQALGSLQWGRGLPLVSPSFHSIHTLL